MHKATSFVIASVLFLGITTALAEGPMWKANRHTLDNCTGISADPQKLMFKSIHLSEYQRQQMRDLMHKMHKDMPRTLNINAVQNMYSLVTSPSFNEEAVRKQIEITAAQQIAHQVQMARVHNQMYNLLTAEQKESVNQTYQQCFEEMEKWNQDNLNALSQPVTP